jgi:3-deoxy-D-manno-octulosonate 8-phosphate phosphatase (KDO 8-P phosphatase)
MAAKKAEGRRPRAGYGKGSRSPALDARLRRIRLLLCDVDGVLTDGAVWMGNGVETKRYNIRDGLGLKMLQHHGVKVGWVSRRPSSATQQRAKDLGIEFLTQSDSGKVAAVESILQKAGCDWAEVCYVGDDIVDAGVLKRAGVAVVVADGVAEAKAAADCVTKAAGGHGAVREVAEMILKAQHKWDGLLAEYAA